MNAAAMNARALVRSLAVVALAGACARTPGGSDGTRDSAVADAPDTPTPPAAATEADLERLEREARALAKAEGCEQSAQCRTAPVGDRPCGGPREYVVYCSLTTDSAALFRKLGELAAAEKAFNARSGMVSTCEFRMPPAVAAGGGRCAVSP
jgi:hypothetical protein